tara:strand:+ start:10991 stop:11422 length:432 start_codon:yes stop_codon:yes gene_type:complete
MTLKQKSLDKYAQYLENLSLSSINSLNNYVTDDVRFKDPFNDVKGSEKMKAVFLHMFDHVSDVKFRINRVYRNDDGGCLEWTFCGTLMNRNWSFDGTSIVILDTNGLVLEHIDHWDAASSFLERIPFLGWIIKLIRKRIMVTG